jgi:Asp/Glu/hydantoin racemase
LKIGIIMNSNKYADNPYEMEPRRKYFASHASPDTEIEFVFPESTNFFTGKPPTNFDMHQLGMEVAQKSVELEKQGFNAAIIYNPYDPGLEAARSLVSMPVIGSGRTSFLTSLMLAEKIGIIAAYDDFIPLTHRWVRTNGFDAFVTSIPPFNVPVTTIRENKNEVKNRFAKIAANLASEGAQMVFPQGLTALMTHIPINELEEVAGMPVADVGAYAIRAAEIIVRLKITQSSIGYPKKRV